MYDVSGKAAVITGSAQGFGKEFAARLLKAGASGVCISDVNGQRGQEAEMELAEQYGQERVLFVRCDVSQESDWNTLWRLAEDKFGYISILINNAGVDNSHGWKKCIDVMLTGTVIGTYLALDKMRKSKGGQGGRIVNISSIAGLSPWIGRVEDQGYCLAKTGVVSLTRGFRSASNRPDAAKDGDGVKCYALCPYFADTALGRAELDNVRQEAEAKLPPFRMMSVTDVADALELAFRRDSNGACLVVYADLPLMDFPNQSYFTFIAFALVGLVAKRMGVAVVGTPTVLLGLAIMAAIILAAMYCALCL